MKFGFDSKKRDKRTIQDGILILGLKLYYSSTPNFFFGKWIPLWCDCCDE